MTDDVPEELVFGSLFGVEWDLQVLNLFANVDELFELIDILNRAGKEFVKAFLEAEGVTVGEILAVELVPSVRVEAFLGAPIAEPLLSNLRYIVVVGLMEAANCRDAH